MNKKGYYGLIGLVCLMLVACATTSSTTEKESPFRMADKRTKAFGQFDYPEISEKEALSLLTDKFQVNHPTYLAQVWQIGRDQFEANDLQAKPQQTAVVAKDIDLNFYSYAPYYRAEKLLAYASVEWQYVYAASSQTSFLATQLLSICSATDDGVFYGKDFDALITQLVHLLQIEAKPQQILADFAQQTTDADLAEKVIFLFDQSQESTQMRKAIYVAYDDKGVMKKVVALVNDLRVAMEK